MFAKHLMGLSARKPEPGYAFGNPGDYLDANFNARRVTYDTMGRILFSVPGKAPSVSSGQGRPSAAGETAVITPDANGAGKIEIWGTDNHGLTTKVRDYPRNSAVGNWFVATGANHAVRRIINNTATFQFRNLATGATWMDPTAYDREKILVMTSREAVWFAADYTADSAFSDTRVFLGGGERSGTALPHPAGRPEHETLPAPLDAGWHRRGPGHDVEQAPHDEHEGPDVPCLHARGRFHPGRTPLPPGHLLNLRDRDRALAGRRRAERPALHPALTVRVPGRHLGGIKPSVAEGIEIVTIGRQLSSGTFTVLQYLDAGDVPTNEYIIESFGTWFDGQDALTTTGTGTRRLPVMVTMNTIIAPTADARALMIHDSPGRT